MNIQKLIDIILNNKIFIFIIGAISGTIISSLISYAFSYIRDRYISRDNMYLKILDNLSEKLYACSQLACNTHIYQLKTSLSIYKTNISTARIIEATNVQLNLKNYESNSKIYDAQKDLLKEKTKLLDTISELHKSLLEIILYIEANYIALNIFSKHRDEYLIISKRMTDITDEILHFLYFDEIEKWEKNLDDTLLILIDNKIDEIEKKYQKLMLIYWLT